MPRQYRGMVADALVARMVDHLHGYELGAEGQNVEVDLDAAVELEDLGQGHALAAPGLDLEDRRAVGLGRYRCNRDGEPRSHCVPLPTCAIADLYCATYSTRGMIVSERALTHRLHVDAIFTNSPTWCCMVNSVDGRNVILIVRLCG